MTTRAEMAGVPISCGAQGLGLATLRDHSSEPRTRLVSLDAGNVRLCHAQTTDFILANHKVLTKGCSRRAGLS